MKTQHTPGPWMLKIWNGYSNDKAHTISTGKKQIAKINWWPDESDTADIEIGKANAKLIAAAPELLDVAKLAFEIMELENDGKHTAVMFLLKQAIDNATK